MNPILIRGGGDLASGVALRLFRSGFPLLITELAQPLAVRRTVAFCEAIYAGQVEVEGVTGLRADSAAEAFDLAQRGLVPVLLDPEAEILNNWPFTALIDARLLKQPAATRLDSAPLVIGLGPGFTAGINCHTLVETQRSHTLGRVYWTGSANQDSGQPDGDPRRVLRAPVAGLLTGHAEIGDHVEPGQILATVADTAVRAPFAGVLRGLLHPGLTVPKGLKIGDVDPRDERSACFLASDKALAIGGGVLEALLSRTEIRAQLAG
jgi:xanthine dehydrogenase accessory factor